MTTIADVAVVSYVERAVALHERARDLDAIGNHDEASDYRAAALMAYAAGRAEKRNPKPDEAPCSLCYGKRTCDITAHLSMRMP